MKLFSVIIILVLMLIANFIQAIKHGERRTDKYNFPLYFMSSIVSLILYYFAGLFDVFFE